MVKKGFLLVFVLLSVFVLPALVSAEVLWNQELSVLNTQAYYSQDYTESDTSDMWLADDFVNTATWNITTIFVPGDFRTPAANTFLNAESLNWEIYGNTGMKPDGDPSGRGTEPVWSLSLPPDDPQVVRTIGTGGEYSDVRLNLTTPVSLDPGTYWLVFYPKMASTYGVYGRQPSLTVNDSFQAKVVQPLGGDDYPTEWTSVLAVTWPADKFPIALDPAKNFNFAFRLEGTVGGVPTPTTLSNPENIVAAGSVLLYGDFGTDGIWLWDSYEWTQIPAGNPKAMVAALGGAGPVLYGDFGVDGIWKYESNAWSATNGRYPKAMAAAGSVLYGDFGVDGIWKYESNAWTKIPGRNPKAIVAAGTVLYGDFGVDGIWKYQTGAWSSTNAYNPESIAAAASVLYGDFGVDGIWKYESNAWTKITPINGEGE